VCSLANRKFKSNNEYSVFVKSPNKENDTRIDKANAFLRLLYRSVVIKRELPNTFSF